MKFNNVIFIGPQGSGKGTQVKVLAEKTGAVIIETGAMAREVAKESTDFGKHVKALIDQGVLLTDEDIQHLVREKLGQIGKDQPAIFDGIPRREGQAVFLFQELQQAGRDGAVTVYISLDRAESMKRLQMRRICENCKTPAIFSGDENQVCAKCGGKLIKRADDTPEAINKRLDQYEAETVPVLEFLRGHGTFFEINGNQPIEKVSADISQALEV